MPPLRSITPWMRRCKSSSGTASTFCAGAHRRIGIAGRAAKLQELTISMRARHVASFSITPKASPGSALRPSVPAAVSSEAQQAWPPQQAFLRFALRQPVESRVGGDANPGLAVLGAGALEKDFRRDSAGPPYLGRTGLAADGATGNRPLQQGVLELEAARREAVD